MRTRFSVALVILTLFCAGCTARTGYDMMRLHQDQRCLELQGADRDRCQQQNEMSYDEYERRLKEREERR